MALSGAAVLMLALVMRCELARLPGASLPLTAKRSRAPVLTSNAAVAAAHASIF
jgi:hypothetical protein